MSEIFRRRDRKIKDSSISFSLLNPKTNTALKYAFMVVLALAVMLVLSGNSYASWTSLMHNSTNTGSTKWSSVNGWGISGGKFGQFTCGTCHTPRAVNIKGVISTIATGDASNWPNGSPNIPVIFTYTTIDSGDPNVAYSFGWDSVTRTTSTRVCEVCHSITNHHRYNNPGQAAHYDGTDCANSCHPHDKGFKVAGGTDCDSCHGNPPSVGTGGGPNGMVSPATNATNPSDPGAHVKHVTTRGISCEACHFGNGMSSTDAKITIGFNINNTTWATFVSSWSGGTFVGYSSIGGYGWRSNGSAVTTTGNRVNSNVCSNIYCHGSTIASGSNKTPQWTSGASQMACGSCHGATTGAPPTLGSHQKHTGAAPTNLALACSECHPRPAYTNGAHVNGNVKWDMWASDSRIGSGTYKGAVSGQTGALAPSSSYGQCGNVYCHSDVQTNGGTSGPSAFAAPAWGSAPTGACGTCHANTTIGTGRHTKHVSTAAYNMPCSNCHNGAGTGTTSHANFRIDVLMDTTYGGSYSQLGWNTPGNGYGTCATNYCHSQANSLTSFNAANIVPNWSTVLPSNCTGCHNNAESTGKWMTSGSHQTHVSLTQDYDCSICHSATVSNNLTVTSFSRHTNRTIDVLINGAWTTGTGAGNYTTIYRAPGSPYGTCTGIYCHSNVQAANGLGKATSYGSPVWGSIGSVWIWGSSGSINDGMCSTTCHQTKISGLNSGSHRRHTWASFNNYPCTNCHMYGGQWTTRHAKGYIDVSINLSFGGSYSQLGTWNTPGNGFGSCSSVYCHSGSTPTWGTGSQACGSCHEGNSALAGAHSKHWSTPGNAPDRQAVSDTTAASYIFRCGVCHYLTNHGGGKVSGNQTAEVNFDPSIAGGGTYFPGVLEGSDLPQNFTFTKGTCATIYCHSNGLTAAAPYGAPNNVNFNWATSNGNSTCYMCHNYNTAGFWMTTGKHPKHVQTYGKSCSVCHNTTTTNGTTISDKRNHVNKQKNVAFDAATNGAWSSVDKTCVNVYCHSNGQTVAKGGAPVSAAVNWTSNAALNCGSCHGIDATGRPWYTTQMPKANSHRGVRHAFIECQHCHSATTSNGTTISNPANHANKTYNVVSWNTFPFTYAYGSIGGSCSTNYCHSTIQNADGSGTNQVQYRTTTWGTGSAGCGGCHQATAAPGTGWLTSGSHRKHVIWLTEGGNGYACSRCHSGVGSGTVAHADKNIQVIFEATSGGSYAGMPNNVPGAGFNSCSGVYCHGSASPTWGGVAQLCGSCHESNNALAGRHSSHWQWVTSSPDRYNQNNSTSASYLFRCGVCHYNTNHAGGVVSTISHADVVFDPTVAQGGSYTPGAYVGWDTPQNFKWTKGSCAGNYCHSNGNGSGPNVTNFNWATSNGLSNCYMCHNYNAAGYWMTTGKHPKHVQTYGNTCNMCHNTTTTNGTSITNKQSHVNSQKNVAFSTVAVGNWNSVTKTCNNNYCHDGGQYLVTRQIYANNNIWTTAGSMTCASCHGKGTSDGRPQYANWTSKANSHVAHPQTCNLCHNATTTNGTSITSVSNHANRVYNMLAGTGVTFNYYFTIGNPNLGGSQCTNVSCHGGGSNRWGAAGGGCLACHNSPLSKTKYAIGSIGNFTAFNRSGWTTQIRSVDNDFKAYASRHIYGGSVLRWDCVVCHREASSSGSTWGTLHGPGNDSTGLIHLRNVDAADQTSGWAINNRAWGTSDFANLDAFCLACHDADGASMVSVNSTNNGVNFGNRGLGLNAGAPWGTIWKSLRPFNSTDQQGGNGMLKASTSQTFSMPDGRVRVVNVKDQFFPGTGGSGASYNGNPSQHAVIGQRYSAPNASWTAAAWATFRLKKNAVNVNSSRETSLLSCADCHVLDAAGGAHGGSNVYNLWDATTETMCNRCHASGVYTAQCNNASRFRHNSDSGNVGGSTAFGMAGTTYNCLLCHAEWNGTSTVSRMASYGGIHGSWSSTATVTGTSTTITAYRFLPGVWRKTSNFSTDDGWRTINQTGTCYFWTGGNDGEPESWTDCNKHSAGSTGSFTPTYGRPTKY